jgi:hypothetical protein
LPWLLRTYHEGTLHETYLDLLVHVMDLTVSFTTISTTDFLMMPCVVFGEVRQTSRTSESSRASSFFAEMTARMMLRILTHRSLVSTRKACWRQLYGSRAADQDATRADDKSSRCLLFSCIPQLLLLPKRAFSNSFPQISSPDLSSLASFTHVLKASFSR